MVRVGVIGVGNMGLYHANLFFENKISEGQLTAVSDSDTNRLDKFKGIKSFTDSQSLIESGLVDAVIIATPHYSHTKIGIAALQRGLHVLVEKPISVHKADGEKLLAAHTNKKQVFAVMFNQRTDPFYRKIKHIIDHGTIGEIQRTSWIITDVFRPDIYYSSGNWRATWAGEGGGVLLNQCPHNLDLFQWICGMPLKVRAFCHLGKWHDIEVEDDVTAYLEYENGATGTFIASTGESPGTNRLEITGDKGKLIYENGKLNLILNQIPTREYKRTVQEMFGKSPTSMEEFIYQDHGGQHREVLQNFIQSIRDGTPLIATGEEGIRSLELGNAMLYSSLTNAIISLPMDGKEYENQLNQLIKNSQYHKNVTEIISQDMTKSFQ